MEEEEKEVKQGATEEEEEEEKKEEVKREKSIMEQLFDFVERNKGQFPFLVKRRNLEENAPRRNEKLRGADERKTLMNLLSTMKGKIETLVVNPNKEHAVTFEQETFKLSLPGFAKEFLQKVEAYEGGLMSPHLVEQCECFLKILIECQSHESVECVIDGIDDAFGSADMMKLFLTMMQELVDGQDRKAVVVKFSEESTRDLIKAFKFMKVFEKTDDANVRKNCCILMF